MSDNKRLRIISVMAIGVILVGSGLMSLEINPSEFAHGLGIIVTASLLSLLVTCLVIRSVSNAAMRRTRELEGRVRRSQSLEEAREPHETEGAKYVIPLSCPFCGKSIRLDEVEWLDSARMLCPECLKTIDVRVDEGV